MPVVAAAEDRQAGDIADAAVGEVGQHGQLLPAGRGKLDAGAGKDFDLLQAPVDRPDRRASPSASQARIVWAGTGLAESSRGPPSWGTRPSPLFQDQAGIGIEPVRAAAERVARSVRGSRRPGRNRASSA